MCSCRCLQTLQLSNHGDQSKQGRTRVVVPAGVGTQLKALVLDGIWSTVVDLSFTTSLSTVSLITIDSCNQLCQLALPSSLQSLTFIGDSLFGIEVNERQLAPLSHLTWLTLGVDGPNGGCASQRALASPAGVVRLPLLPSSLRHLPISYGQTSSTTFTTLTMFRDNLLLTIVTGIVWIHAQIWKG